MRATITIEASDGAARTGSVNLARGSFRSPCFMPVGTRGTIKALSSADVEDLGAELILANTYHLMLRPGARTVERLGGIHGFAAWRGLVLTDSGGFQTMSLSPAIDDDGVSFRSVYDGSRHRLTPESAVSVQEQLGADIQMVLDVCSPLPADELTLRIAVERTASWAKRARAAHRRIEDQSLFGIVQGGVDPALRKESAERTVEIGFDGYAVGGLSVGESRAEMLESLAVAVPHLPPDQPRYLMGLGDPVGLVEAVALGVDMFDCVAPTRLARHGTLLTSAGKLSLRRAEMAQDAGPIDPACTCATCARWSRAYLRHLLTVNEPTVLRLLSIHNLTYVLGLMARTRAAIKAGTLGGLRSEVATVYGD
jgi:queuine tRNA-ribosyltransferase